MPTSKDERLLAAAEARRRDPILRRASTVSVRAMCREWHLAGWNLIDILAALNRRPDGTPWPHQLTASDADVRHVPGWVRHRLRAWRTDPTDPASPPAPSPTQRCLTAAARNAQTAAARRAQIAAARANAVPCRQVDGWDSARAAVVVKADQARDAHRTARHEPQQLVPAPELPPPTRPTTTRHAIPQNTRPAPAAPDRRIAALRAAIRRS